MQLRMTDGLTTIYLSGADGVITGCTYFPQTGNALTMEDVTGETAEINIVGTESAIVGKTAAIERMFETARLRHQRRAGRHVFIEYQTIDGAAWYRAELKGGDLLLHDQPHFRKLTNGLIRCKLIWDRRFYWESVDLLPIPISNPGGGPTTDGLILYNHTDGTAGHNNYADIAANKVAGTLRAPAHVVLTHVGAQRYYKNLYLLTAALDDPSTFTHIYEAEQAAGAPGPFSAANASNGSYRQISATTAEKEFYWEGEALNASILWTVGRSCRVLGRLHTISQSTVAVFARVELRIDSRRIVLSKTDEIQLPTAAPALIDFGMLTMPEFANRGASLHVVLRAQGTNTVGIDFVQMAPADGLRVYPMAGQSMTTDYFLTDDPSLDLFYRLRLGVWPEALPVRPRGQLWLTPKKAHRIHILGDTTTGMAIDDRWKLNLYYRPRRLTID